jgi:hypothetical protein
MNNRKSAFAAMCFALLTTIFTPGKARADDEDDKMSMTESLLLYGRMPEDVDDLGNSEVPRLWAFQLLRAGFHRESYSFRNIPEHIRTVHPYHREKTDVLLPEHVRGHLIGMTVGTGVTFMQRFELAVEFTIEEMNDTCGYIWYPSNDAVGYIVSSDITTLSLSTRVLYGLHVKMGYRARWLDLYSGHDAWASFHTQHRWHLPRQDLMVYALAYKVLQPYFKWYDDWVDLEVEYGATISPEHDAHPYFGLRVIVQTMPFPE